MVVEFTRSQLRLTENFVGTILLSYFGGRWFLYHIRKSVSLSFNKVILHYLCSISISCSGVAVAQAQVGDSINILKKKRMNGPMFSRDIRGNRILMHSDPQTFSSKLHLRMIDPLVFMFKIQTCSIIGP